MLISKSWKSKINGMKLVPESPLKFQKFENLQIEVLVRDFCSRSTKFLFEVFLCVPTMPEVGMGPLQSLNSKLVILNEAGPFQLKLFTG